MAVQKIVDTVNKYGFQKTASYISFTVNDLSTIKDYDPRARLGILNNVFESSLIDVAISLQTDENEVFISAGITTTSPNNATDTDIKNMWSNGIPLEAWTFNAWAWLPTMCPYVTGLTAESLYVEQQLWKNLGGKAY